MKDGHAAASPRPASEKASRRGLLRGGAGVLVASLMVRIGVPTGEPAVARTKRRPKKKGRGCGNGGTCRVFITSSAHNGNLGGLAGADAMCQKRAKAAGLPGSYKAWLSDTKETPRSRFMKSNGPYRLVDGTKIASNWDDLITKKANGDYLAAPINLTETGITIAQTEFAWSNTQPDGHVLQGSTYHCSNWDAVAGNGIIGTPQLTQQFWSAFSFTPCTDDGHLFCFQQG